MKKFILIIILASSMQLGYAQKELEVCYYTHVEEMPLFNGAKNLKESLRFLNQYLKEKVKTDTSHSSRGLVRLSFLIDPKGAPVEIEILNSTDSSLDRIAIGYLQEMPQWEPGKIRGEAVYVQETVAVKFE